MTWSVLPSQVGLRYNAGTSPRRADRAPGRCRAGGGLLGGKDPAGRFLLSSPLAAAAVRAADQGRSLLGGEQDEQRVGGRGRAGAPGSLPGGGAGRLGP